jgi:DNA-3-methyladenine glycosylase II
MSEDPIASLRSDPALGPLIEEHGRLTIDPASDFFPRFVTSILRQQVSIASAAAVRERLFDAVEMTPEGVLAAEPETLRDAGLSGAKTRYVRNLAEAFRDRGYSKTYFDGMDNDAVMAELTSIKGIGPWTARMQLLFSLGREDVFPVGDLGVRKGMWALFGEDMTRDEMVARAKRWAPYRSYATIYLWRIEEDVDESVAEVQRV